MRAILRNSTPPNKLNARGRRPAADAPPAPVSLSSNPRRTTAEAKRPRHCTRTYCEIAARCVTLHAYGTRHRPCGLISASDPATDAAACGNAAAFVTAHRSTCRRCEHDEERSRPLGAHHGVRRARGTALRWSVAVSAKKAPARSYPDGLIFPPNSFHRLRNRRKVPQKCERTFGLSTL